MGDTAGRRWSAARNRIEMEADWARDEERKRRVYMVLVVVLHRTVYLAAQFRAALLGAICRVR